MSVTPLSLLKQQCRAEDFDDSDELLQQKLDDAEEWVCVYTHRTLADLVARGRDGALPGSVRQAVLMLAAHWYNQAEAAVQGAMTEVPFAIGALLKPWRKFEGA